MATIADYSKLDMEWVKIAWDKAIVATANRVWVCRLEAGDGSASYLEKADSSPRDRKICRQLLDAAILLAKREGAPQSQTPALTQTRWVWDLAAQYHLTHSTPMLMEEAARRFAALGEQRLCQWATHKAIEESGHDRLALLDLQSLRYNAEATVITLAPPSAIAMVDYFKDCVRGDDPVACVGYTYALERSAVAIGEQHIRALEARLPSGINATRRLRVHSGVGSDVEHVDETLDLVAELTPQQRACVVKACYETALLSFASSREQPSDGEIRQHLELLVAC